MTPDVEAIRQALAAATPPSNENAADDWYRWYTTRCDLMSNAPMWLAQCLTEIERLRASREYWVTERSEKISLDLAAALAECERLRAPWLTDPIGVAKAERDAWRACADQLAFVLKDARLDPDHAVYEALAVYEKLKGADS